MRKKKKQNLKINFVPKNIFTSLLIGIMLIGGAFYLTSHKEYIDNSPKVIALSDFEDEEDFLEKLKENGLIKNRIQYYRAVFGLNVKKVLNLAGYGTGNKYTALVVNSLSTDLNYEFLEIEEGLRKEEIADHVAETLSWEEQKIETLKKNLPICSFSNREGYLASGEYLIRRDASIQEIQKAMKEKFNAKFENLEGKHLSKLIEDNFTRDEIVIVASLIQREAAGRGDARLVSGIIWNRILRGMPLQIDATLQYIKGNEETWWPLVYSEDKFLDSPFNTYQIPGLPPAPIASPGETSLAAAMNPIRTSCLFYIHDPRRNIHCSSTYSGHLQNIKRYLR